MKNDFKEILGNENFNDFCLEKGLKKPTDIQVKAMPMIMEDHDIVAMAKTGSGKTLAYLMPFIQKIKNDEQNEKHLKRGAPLCVVLVPIKELAHQVSTEAKGITHHIKVRARTAVGGVKGKRVQNLSSGVMDLLIATPGRLVSMLKSKEIKLSSLKYLVIDEADQLMDMGFIKDLATIKGHLEQKVQVALFSATRPTDFETLTQEVFSGYDFKDINLAANMQETLKIDTFNISLEYTEKKSMLKVFLDKEAKGSGVIFVNQKGTVGEVVEFLEKQKLNSKLYFIHGDVSQEIRKKTMEEFRKNKGILVTTDIMARGIDIKGLMWVLNYDLPFEEVYYIHRAGRVGRHGKTGMVYNFVTKKDLKLIVKINESIQNQTALNIGQIQVKEERKSKHEQSKNSKTTKKVTKKITKKTTKKTGKKVTKNSSFKDKPARKVVARKKTPRYKRK